MDRIFYNGVIYTMDAAMPRAEAVAVKNGVIIRVGTDDEVLSLRTKKTELVDLGKRVMLPGFCDSHMHLLSYGYSLEKVNLGKATCMDDIVSLGREFLSKHPHLAWLQGRGWNTDGWDDPRFPTRYDLDRITTDVPMFYTRSCGHIIIVNSKALEIMGVTRDTPQIPGGRFDLDENGEPLGIFREAARDIVYNAVPHLAVEDIRRMLIAGGNELLKCGITNVQTDDFEAIAPGEYKKVLAAYESLAVEGTLPVRVYEQCLLPPVLLLRKFLSEGHYTGQGDPMFRIGPLKLLADGSLGGRTAFLGRPYADDCSTRGIAVFTQDELNELVETAHNNRMTVAVHCIGDGTMRMTLDAIERAQLRNPLPDMRHSIIHCQITDRAILERFQKLNIIAHIQPSFINSDMYIVRDRVGAEMEKTSYNWKRMLELGILIACGSDSPVESFSVMNGIYCAVTRKDFRGRPDGGWLPDQKISVLEAVRAYTLGGAYASYDEGVKGSIRNGKYADFAVIDRDIFSIPAEEIKDVAVYMTVLNGNIVYN